MSRTPSERLMYVQFKSCVYWGGDWTFRLSCNYHCVKSVQMRRFFRSVFSCIWTKYGDLRSKSPYSVWLQENTDQKKLRIWTLFTHCTWTKLEQHFPNAQFNINGYEIRKTKDRGKHGWRLREFLRQGFISKRMEE